MVVEAVQNYVNLVNGLTRMTRERAIQTARALLTQAGLEGVANDAEKRVSQLADEILSASRANRTLVENLVAGEVDKAAAHWGYVRSAEVEALREEIAELRRSLVKATVDNARQPEPPVKRAAKTSARKTSSAGRTVPTRKTASQGPPLGGGAGTAGSRLPDPPLGEPLVTDPGEPSPTPLIQSPAEVAAQPPSSPEASTPIKSAVKKTAAKKAAAKKSPATRTPATRTPATRTPTTGTSTARPSSTRASTTRASSKRSAPAELPAPAAPLTTPLPETGTEGEQ